MVNNNLVAEIEKLKGEYQLLTKELSRIKDDNSRALRRGVLSEAGATTEKILKFIYKKEGLDKNSKPSDKMMLDELLTEINRRPVIPNGIMIHFRTLQQWRNIGSHDKGDILEEVDQNAILTVNTSVAAVVNWFFNEYLKSDFPEHFFTENTDNENCVKNSLSTADAIDEWKEHFWWTMKHGNIKLLEQKSLDAIQKNNQLTDEVINSIKNSFTRNINEFSQILKESLEDNNLEEYEINAIEHCRIEYCISIKEAKDLLSQMNIQNINTSGLVQINWIKEIIDNPSGIKANQQNIKSDNIESEKSIDIENILNNLSNSINFEKLFWHPNIPEKKIKNSIKSYNIPSNEKILCLIDSTIFGGAENGLAITLRGIYLHNDWTAKSSGTFFFSWDKFNHFWRDLKATHTQIKNEVLVCQNVYFNISAFSAKHEDVEMFFSLIIHEFANND